MHKTIIINGSVRRDGDMSFRVQELVQLLPPDAADHQKLIDWDFSHYDYDHLNKDDEFLPHVRRMVEEYDTWVLATPVYWYAMSGLMKQFIDRLTDCITIEKETGRKFRGKRLAVMTVSNGNNLGDQFWLPFQMTADYLGMDFLGGVHLVNGVAHEEVLKGFVDRLSTNV